MDEKSKSELIETKAPGKRNWASMENFSTMEILIIRGFLVLKLLSEVIWMFAHLQWQ